MRLNRYQNLTYRLYNLSFPLNYLFSLLPLPLLPSILFPPPLLLMSPFPSSLLYHFLALNIDFILSLNIGEK